MIFRGRMISKAFSVGLDLCPAIADGPTAMPTTTVRKRIAYAAVIVTGIYLILIPVFTLSQRCLKYHPTKACTEELEALARRSQFEIWNNANGVQIGWNAGQALDWVHYANALQTHAVLDVFTAISAANSSTAITAGNSSGWLTTPPMRRRTRRR